MIESIRCLTAYLLILLVCLLAGGAWVLRGPSESDHAAIVALDINDAITAARADKENHE